MHSGDHLLLAGASVRAAAFSALRAGLRPWCVDLFADADLQARCPAVALPPGKYPEGLVKAFRAAPPGPWLYTGALENRPALVNRLLRQRPLWGNDANTLHRVRDPFAVAALLHSRGIACARVRRDAPGMSSGRWLVKPRAGAGGRGIRFWDGTAAAGRVYFQEHIEGQAVAAVYLGDGQSARLLGVTRQLVGVGWLHAGPFHYCGSIGPLSLGPALMQAFADMGTALGEGFGLRGLFGVDTVVRAGIPYLVEVNPRYTASMEIVEHASGRSLLGLHRQIFEAGAPLAPVAPPACGILGKAILFARQDTSFPAEGPWTDALRPSTDPWELPAFADILQPGTRIEAGRPVLSFFTRAASVAACLEALCASAAELA